MSQTIKYSKLSNEKFILKVIAEKQPSVLMFGASWSGNSTIMDSMMERLSKEDEYDVQFYKIDIEDEPRIAEFFNIFNIPTTVMIKEGEIMDLYKGLVPASKLRQKIAEIYGNAS